MLHFGWFGGWPLTIAYGFLGLALTVLTATGVTIWIARRRDQGRAVPGWERLWTAFVWGQPVAVAGSALAALLMPALEPVAVWGTLSLCCCAYAAVAPAERISLHLRLWAAALLALTAATHVLVWAGRPADVMAWVVDGALLLIAIVLAFGVLPVPTKTFAKINLSPNARGS
jgi:uncharacterized iron-regulated membrane protein